MSDLRRKIDAEKQYIVLTLDNLVAVLERPERSIVELAAIATFLHNVYNGIENVLKMVFKAHGIEIPSSETWHKDLLAQAISRGMVSDEVGESLYEYLAFRHFFVHGYGFMLEEEALLSLAEGVAELYAHFEANIEGFLADKQGNVGGQVVEVA